MNHSPLALCSPSAARQPIQKLIAPREIADADEASSTQNFFRNGHIGYPCRAAGGQLTQDVFNVVSPNAQHFQEYTDFLKLLERTLARRLGIIAFAIRHKSYAEGCASAADRAVYSNCSLTHGGCHCFFS